MAGALEQRASAALAADSDEALALWADSVEQEPAVARGDEAPAVAHGSTERAVAHRSTECCVGFRTQTLAQWLQHGG